MVSSIWLRLWVGKPTSSLRAVSRCGGSKFVSVDPKGPTRFSPSNSIGHSHPPVPDVMASHTSPGVASTSNS